MKRTLLFITFLLSCEILFSQETSDPCVIKAPAKLEREGSKQQIHVRFESVCPISDLEITIYNRWGNVLYISNQLDHLWQGKDKEPGTYFFVIKGTFQDGGKINQNGYFTIL
jgi:hypothetical protein